MADETILIPTWTLGDRLAKAREHAGLSIEEMADVLVRDRSTIGRYENDRNRPPRRVLRRWAEVTGVPLEWIVGGDDAWRRISRRAVRTGSISWPRPATVAADLRRPAASALNWPRVSEGVAA
jgi:transcriptional regulator with XRE-family HTH domain